MSPGKGIRIQRKVGRITLTIGIALTSIGLVGILQGRLFFRTVIPNETHNEALYLAWYWTIVAEALFATGSFLLMRSTDRSKAYAILFTTTLGSIVTTLVVGLIYSYYIALTILGNDSKRWEISQQDMGTIFLGSIVGGAILSLAIVALIDKLKSRLTGARPKSIEPE